MKLGGRGIRQYHRHRPHYDRLLSNHEETATNCFNDFDSFMNINTSAPCENNHGGWPAVLVDSANASINSICDFDSSNSPSLSCDPTSASNNNVSVHNELQQKEIYSEAPQNETNYDAETLNHVGYGGKVECISKTRETNKKNEDTVQLLQQQIVDLTNQRDVALRILDTIKAKMNEWEGSHDELLVKIDDLAKENGKLLNKCKRLEGSNGEEMEKLRYAELLDKTKNLSNENDQLAIKCQQLESKNAFLEASIAVECLDSSFTKEAISNMTESLQIPHLSRRVSFAEKFLATPITEMERAEALALIEELEAENETSLQSMTEAVQLASSMKLKMKSLTQAHEARIKEYEERLACFQDNLGQAALSGEELSAKLREMKEANKSLQSEVDHHKEEKETAYATCEVLQHEIDFLRHACEESKVNVEVHVA